MGPFSKGRFVYLPAGIVGFQLSEICPSKEKQSREKLYCLWEAICLVSYSPSILILEYILLDEIIAYYSLTKTIIIDRLTLYEEKLV